MRNYSTVHYNSLGLLQCFIRNPRCLSHSSWIYHIAYQIVPYPSTLVVLSHIHWFVIISHCLTSKKFWKLIFLKYYTPDPVNELIGLDETEASYSYFLFLSSLGASNIYSINITVWLVQC